MVYLKLLAVVSLLGTIAWVVVAPGFDSSLAAIGSISALVGLFGVDKEKKGESTQEQVVSNSSVGIQAGGDVNIGNLNRKNDV